MLPNLGNLLLVLSAILGVTIFACSFSYKYGSKYFGYLWFTLLLTSICSFGILIYSFAVSDFSVLSVINHSSLQKPFLFKISAAWGHHEGSMLLWLNAIAFYGVLYFIISFNTKLTLRISTLGFQGLLYSIFAFFTFLFSNPFKRVFPPTINGMGLNPILQDVGLALHPPMLYMGYVGSSIAFAFALSWMTNGIRTKNDIIPIYICTIMAWICLTLGVGLGSWWAYRELGWGGYWFWDPVENSSLMPWIALTAMIHAIKAFIKTGRYSGWVLFYMIFAFSLSMIGTFLVRSGLITSVHSFATDPTRGIYILIIIFIFYILSAILYGMNQHKIHTPQAKLHLQSKAGLILINNLFNLLIIAIILLGTIYPMLLDLFAGKKITVGAPYFNKILSPIALFLLFAAAFNNRLAWDKSRQLMFKSFAKELAFAFVLTGLIFGCNSFAIELSVLGIFVALFFIAMNAVKKNTWAVYLAHMGFAVLILGLSLNTYFSRDIETVIHPNNSIELSNFAITFHGIEYVEQNNYVARRVEFSIIPSYAEGPFYLYPETRLYLIEQQQTAEAAIYHNFFYDFYLTIGNINEDGGIVMRAYLRPAMLLIWMSCLSIAGAGMGLFRFLTSGFLRS